MSTIPANITEDWTVNEVVGVYPKTLPVFGRYRIDSCCGGLKTLAEVASIHHLPLDQLLADLQLVIAPPSPIVLDVRPDLQAGNEPFQKIMTAVAGLGKDQDLVILVGFEPVPLYNMLGKQGFTHRSERVEGGDWRVTFTRRG